MKQHVVTSDSIIEIRNSIVQMGDMWDALCTADFFLTAESRSVFKCYANIVDEG